MNAWSAGAGRLAAAGRSPAAMAIASFRGDAGKVRAAGRRQRAEARRQAGQSHHRPGRAQPATTTARSTPRSSGSSACRSNSPKWPPRSSGMMEGEQQMVKLQAQLADNLRLLRETQQPRSGAARTDRGHPHADRPQPVDRRLGGGLQGGLRIERALSKAQRREMNGELLRTTLRQCCRLRHADNLRQALSRLRFPSSHSARAALGASPNICCRDPRAVLWSSAAHSPPALCGPGRDGRPLRPRLAGADRRLSGAASQGNALRNRLSARSPAERGRAGEPRLSGQRQRGHGRSSSARCRSRRRPRSTRSSNCSGGTCR